MPSISISSNIPQLLAWIGKLSSDQVPFASARALTWTAKAVQGKVRSELSQRFTIRSTWVSRGIQVVPAEKKDWPNQVATAGSRDGFMEPQEVGAEKVPIRSKNVAIPGRATKRGAGGRIPTAKKPRAQIDRPDVFVRHGEILKRSGPSGRGRLEVLFLLRKETRIRPRFGFRETSEEVVREMYPRFFRSSLDQAIAAPKPRLERL